MEEIWKEIDDRYSISNLGRIKSNYANKERILNPWLNQDGYRMIELHHPGEKKAVGVHRLVALAFIPNPNNYKEVNHKDENKQNNCADNLEWCDTKYNCNYGTRNIRKAEHCKKPIYSVDKNGNVEYFDSARDAGAILGIHPTSITKAMSDKYPQNKTAAGRKWYYNISANND